MIIKNCIQNSDGDYDFDMSMSAEETEFLVDYAVRDLMHQGLIKISADEAEQELELFKELGGQPS